MIQITKIAVVACGALALAACEKRADGTYSTPTPTGPGYEQKKTDETPSESKVKKDLDDLTKIADKKVEGPNAKGGGPMYQEGSREWARDKMAHVRCDHYKSCGDVARDKKYDTYDSCVTRENANLDKDWKLDECGKIDTPRLDACMKAVQTKKCDVLFNTTPSECATSKVCIDTEKK